MNFKKFGGILLAWAAGFLLLPGNMLCPDSAQAEVVIIANQSVSVNSITRSDLGKIYTGKEVVWGDGQSIKPALLKEGELHTEFIKNYIKRTPNQFINYWRRMIFTGQGIQPSSFDDTQALIKYVAETPGAIGYISSSDDSPQTKTLTISGN